MTAAPAPTGAAAPPKPRPLRTPLAAPFWAGLSEGRIRLLRCDRCRAWVHYPRRRCPGCLSDELSWEEVAPTGVVYAATTARQATAPPFADEVPQRIAVVELDCGARFTTTLVEARDSELAVGTPVTAVFDTGPDGVTLLRFRPLEGEGR